MTKARNLDTIEEIIGVFFLLFQKLETFLFINIYQYTSDRVEKNISVPMTDKEFMST